MTKNLTAGNPMKLILGFALPTVCGLIFQQMYNMVDTMIVGKLLGSGALAAVGATGSISFLVLGFCIGVCTGFAIPVAREMGAQDLSSMRRHVANAAFLGLVFAAATTLLTCLFCRTILTVMQTPADIYEDSLRYIFVIFLGLPAAYLYNLLAGILRSLGDSRTPVLFLALSSVLNIGLDFYFLLQTDLGVAGASVATVISQTVSGLACLAWVAWRFPVLRMSREERALNGAICRELCRMGIPMGLQYSITAVGSIILQSAVNGLGSLAVAAVAAGFKLYQVLACPLDALGAAIATYCGQNVGAGRLERLGQGIRDCSLLGLGYSLLCAVAMTFWAPECAMWFLDPADENILDLLPMVSRYVHVTTLFFFALTLVIVVRFAIQGMGYSFFAIVSGVIEMVARTLTAVLLIPAFGFSAVCAASPVAWIGAVLFLVPACVSCIRRLFRNQILPGDQPQEYYGRVPRQSSRPFRIPFLRLRRSHS